MESDLIESVISLSSNLLAETSVPPCVLILNKSKGAELRGKIHFVYADEIYHSAKGSRRELTSEDLQRITEIVFTRATPKQIATIASIEEIASRDYNLMPARYVKLFDSDNFLGGTAEWKKLSTLAHIERGTTKLGNTEGETPVIRGRDLSSMNLSISDLLHIEVPSNVKQTDFKFAEAEDILIQRIGHSPRAAIATNDLNGVLVNDTAYIVKLKKEYRYLAHYFVEFLNSDRGATLLSLHTRGAAVQSLTLGALRQLPLPIPPPKVVELISELHLIEQTFATRMEETRNLRQKLFNIDDAEEVDSTLKTLNTDAQTLKESIVQVNDPEYRIRNFYPHVLAYTYRTLDSVESH